MFFNINERKLRPDLATLLTLALLRAAMDPVVMYTGLLAVLTHPHIPEGGLARELDLIHQDPDTVSMGDDLTS